MRPLTVVSLALACMRRANIRKCVQLLHVLAHHMKKRGHVIQRIIGCLVYLREWRGTHWQGKQLLQMRKAGRCSVISNQHVVGHTQGQGWEATCAIQKLESSRTGTKRIFSELLEEIEGNHTRCLCFTFQPVHYELELWVSIQQHGVSRYRNESIQALQSEFCRQDDGISTILFKQSNSTKVGLSATSTRDCRTQLLAAAGDTGPPSRGTSYHRPATQIWARAPSLAARRSQHDG